MVRRWLVRPDQVMYVEGVGELPHVSRQAMQEAMLDAEALIARAGGHVTVSTDRHPTGFPGEMVTTAAAFLWRDRTDAKEQPEQPAPVAAAPAPEPEVEAAYASQAAEDAALVAEHDDVIGDGLDPSTLEEEDVSSIPEPAR